MVDGLASGIGPHRFKTGVLQFERLGQDRFMFCHVRSLTAALAASSIMVPDQSGTDRFVSEINRAIEIDFLQMLRPQVLRVGENHYFFSNDQTARGFPEAARNAPVGVARNEFYVFNWFHLKMPGLRHCNLVGPALDGRSSE